MGNETIIRSNDDKIDRLEAAMLENFPEIDCPLEHLFPKGLYVRSIFMKAGSFITSKIHKYEHPYIVSQGMVSVWIEGEEMLIKAPYAGITKSGTRRVLYIHEDCVWTTVHQNPNDETDLEKIEEMIIEKHENKLLNNKLKINELDCNRSSWGGSSH